MGSMFYKCNKLKYLSLSNFNTSLNKKIDSMFSECTSLKVLDIPSFNLKNIEEQNNYRNLFTKVKLKYLNIYDIQNYKDIFDVNLLNNSEKFIVCEKDDIIKGDNIIKACCHYDTSNDELIPDMPNYIEVK